MASSRCPCLSGLPFAECCGPIIAGETSAPTAERLMRSRFSAFAVGDAAYLLESWHPSSRPDSLELDDTLRWYRLDIVGTSGGGPLDSRGTVEFVAYFKSGGGPSEQHELSSFVREGGRWFYVAGG